jgi:hypothetical protein
VSGARALVAAAAAALAACHSHLERNAPGVVDPATPPARASRTVEPPGDPGERFVVLSPGVVVAGGGRSDPARGVFDAAIEVTVDLGERDTSHNDHRAGDRLFVPRGWQFPPRGIGFTLGWSALRVTGRTGEVDGDGDGALAEERAVSRGPLYAEAHRFWSAGGLGGGWTVDPFAGQHGPELFGYLMIYHLRARYLIGEGYEVLVGVQLKLPHAWIWSR